MSGEFAGAAAAGESTAGGAVEAAAGSLAVETAEFSVDGPGAEDAGPTCKTVGEDVVVGAGAVCGTIGVPVGAVCARTDAGRTRAAATNAATMV
jgi:hypothetical protein